MGCFLFKVYEENITIIDLDDDMDSIPDFKTFEHNMYTYDWNQFGCGIVMKNHVEFN